MAIGVPRPLALEKPQSVDLAQAARYFGAHGEPDAATLTLLQKCAVPLLAAAMPRAVWLLADTPAPFAKISGIATLKTMANTFISISPILINTQLIWSGKYVSSATMPTK